MFSVDEVLTRYYPELDQKVILRSLLRPLLKWLLHEKAFQDFAEQYPHLAGIDFVEQVLEYFDFSFVVPDQQRMNIPATGKVVIIANHPIGSLDGLALLKLVHDIRSDVKIVANDLLTTLSPLRNMLLPVRNMSGDSRKQHIQRIHNSLADGAAVIIFPAGEVSRATTSGIKDPKWQHGFIKVAERAKAPIVPIHISARNSTAFYLASLLAKPVSTLMLVKEMFKQQRRQARINIGEIIPFTSYAELPVSKKEKAKLFKKHVYRLGSGKKPLLKSEAPIALPERRIDLKRQIKQGLLLGKTPDDKLILLFDRLDSSPILREIGRLRELSFRTVGEGTGFRRDIDIYDQYYKHLVLWDEEDLEIAGAYRFVDSAKVLKEHGQKGLYSMSLFNMDEGECPFLREGLELGRSFVQPRYWGKRSLDYLWYGIGAFLARNTQYRFLFGPVSISSAMPQTAKELLIYFYKLYFTRDHEQIYSRNPFTFSLPVENLASEFTGDDYKQDLIRLKTVLANLGTAIPTLYKQYTELCEPGGVVFLDFNVDPAFRNCIDGLVVVDTCQLKTGKRRRYLEKHNSSQEQPPAQLQSLK